MQRFRFPLAVAATSLALVLGLVVVGGLLASSALASGNLFGGPWGGGPWGSGAWAGGRGGPGFALPPELASLRDVPADQRFGHFRGVRVDLTDRDGRPLTIEVTPGTVATVDATSLTLTANDGSSKSYTRDDHTLVHGRTALSQNDRVVVVTLNGQSTARAILVPGDHGFGPHS